MAMVGLRLRARLTIPCHFCIPKEHAASSVTTGLPRAGRLELGQASWRASLENSLAELGRVPAAFITQPREQPWKIALAPQIRDEYGASIPWSAEHLHLGAAATVRGYLHQARKDEN